MREQVRQSRANVNSKQGMPCRLKNVRIIHRFEVRVLLPAQNNTVAHMWLKTGSQVTGRSTPRSPKSDTDPTFRSCLRQFWVTLSCFGVGPQESLWVTFCALTSFQLLVQLGACPLLNTTDHRRDLWNPPCFSGKSKRGLSKRGLAQKAPIRPRQPLFREISALGRNYVRPPPLPMFWLEGFCQGRGWECMCQALCGRNFIPPPSFLYTPHP